MWEAAEEKWRETAVNVLGRHTPMGVVKEQNGVHSHFCSYGTPLHSHNTWYAIIPQRSRKSAIPFTSIRKICQSSLRLNFFLIFFFFCILWQLRDRFLTPEAHSLLSCPRGKGGGCIKEVGSSSGSKLKKSDTFGAPCQGTIIKGAPGSHSHSRNNKGTEKEWKRPDLILKQQFHHPQAAVSRAEAPIVLVLGQLPTIVPEMSICSSSISCQCIFPNVVTFLLPPCFCLGFNLVISANPLWRFVRSPSSNPLLSSAGQLSLASSLQCSLCNMCISTYTIRFWKCITHWRTAQDPSISLAYKL